MRLLLRLWLAVLFGSPLPALTAGDTALRPDSREVCLIQEGVVHLGPRLGATRPAALPAGFAKPVLGVAATPTGWLLLTKQALWSWRGAKQAPERLATAPAGIAWTDLARDPQTGNVLLTGWSESGPRAGELLRLYVADSGKLERVYARRVSTLSSPSFGPDGALFFASRGDLWQGRLAAPERAPDEKDAPPWSLEAERCLPLAYLETQNSTPASFGVSQTAATATHVYLQIYRLGGSGFGWIARWARSKTPAFATLEEKGPQALWQAMAENLRTVENLGAQPRPAHLAASIDGVVIYDLPDGPRRHPKSDSPAERE